MSSVSGKGHHYGYQGESAFEGMGLKRALPEGTIHTNKDNIETFDIPAGPKRRVLNEELVKVSVLPEWAQAAFPGVECFNPVQSKVLNSAFSKNENILVSAPTGES